MESIDVNSNREITLFTDDEKIVLKVIDFELEQTNKIRGFYNKLTVFNGNHCYQLIRNKNRRKIKFRIDINYLNPVPTRQHKVAWKWLLAAFPFLVISFAMIYAALFSESFEPSNYFMTVLVSVSLLSLIGILLTIHYSYDNWVYKSEYGDVSLIELLNNQPDTYAFKDFLDRLSLQINQAKSARDKTQPDSLADELRELRRLKDETVITDHQYESAKQLIFKHEGFGNIASR